MSVCGIGRALAASMGGRVLVADDDPDLLASVAEALSHLGAEVVTASTGAELLERIAEDLPFDLVITDVSMPWMTGLQVARSVREAGLHVPVIIMTGLGDESLDERVSSLGERTLLLRKPFGAAELRAAAASFVPALVTDLATCGEGALPRR